LQLSAIVTTTFETPQLMRTRCATLLSHDKDGKFDRGEKQRDEKFDGLDDEFIRFAMVLFQWMLSHLL
jgi:hypothetical protein